MKKCTILLSVIALTYASESIQLPQIEQLADRFVEQRYGQYHLRDVMTYYGLDELPNAYALVYQNAENEPLTIVMGARYTTSPISEISRTLPRSQKVYEKVIQKARTLGYGEPEFQRIYYFGPGEEYCAFRVEGKDILVNACNFTAVEKSLLVQSRPEPNPELELLTRSKWEKYFQTVNFSARQDSGYIPDVPFIDWVYGCSPTAASMILWYWDEYAPGAGYGRLVDHFYTHYDTPEGEWNECANVNRELALAMYTDTASGGTSSGNIVDGILAVTANNGYSFTGQSYGPGNASNQYMFNWVEYEIDNERPFYMSLQQYWYAPFNDYIGHGVTGVGYQIILPDTFVQVHNTWDIDEPLWPLWTYYNGVYSYNYVRVVRPGGAIDDNIFLDWPVGATLSGSALTQRAVIFAGVTYQLRWHTQGSNIDHIKISYATGRDGQGYDSLQWALIDANAPNTGEYLWTVPDGALEDDTLRINIVGLNSSNVRLAADGCFGSHVVTVLDHSPEVSVVGHVPTLEGWSRDVRVSGDYLYIADGGNGLVVVDVTEPGLPEVIGHLALPGHAYCLDVVGDYVYLGDQEDTLRVVSVSDPANPVEVGKCAVGSDALDVFVVGSNVFVAARTEGLVVVSVAAPSAPSVIGQWDTGGFSYDVYVDGGYAYVADATTGMRVIDVSDPQNPVEVGYYDTNGISYGVTKSGSYVYCADGTQGVKVFDAASPDTLVLLGSFDTPVTATKVQKLGSALYVADGMAGGIRVIDVSDPGGMSELGYIISPHVAGGLWLSGDSLVYLADGLTGVMVIDRDALAVVEQDVAEVFYSVGVVPSFGRVSDSYTISLAVTRSVEVAVRLFDCVGRYVEDVYCGRLAEGVSELQWRPRNLPAGIYFMQVKANDFKSIQKLVLVK
jgi:hypothetical protein